MQRLRELLRARDERGAVSVMVALLMVPLIAFAAIAIDVAAMYAERQQLQTGADAAALAIAQDCARNNCGAPGQTAQDFAEANMTIGDGEVTATLDAVPTPASGQVTVQNSGVSEHLFAPIFGPEETYDQTNLTARATAGWGYPVAGTAVLPLIIGKCEFEKFADSKEQLSILPGGSDEDCIGEGIPGGFGWLKTIGGTCQASSAVGTDFLGSQPGNSLPSGCDPSEVQDLGGATVLLPLFGDSYPGGSGSNAYYDVIGYAAFTLTGYAFVGGGAGGASWGVQCPKSENTCITGQFVEYVDQARAFEYSPDPTYDFGAAIVSLLPEPRVPARPSE